MPLDERTPDEEHRRRVVDRSQRRRIVGGPKRQNSLAGPGSPLANGLGLPTRAARLESDHRLLTHPIDVGPRRGQEVIDAPNPNQTRDAVVSESGKMPEREEAEGSFIHRPIVRAMGAGSGPTPICRGVRMGGSGFGAS